MRIHERFDDDRAPGDVVGSETSAGVTRRGRDAEGVLSIDHGALRIAPLTHPSWGRSVVAYGPVPRRCGRAVSMLVLNGHHSSENTDAWPGLPRYALQWMRGSQVDPPLLRIAKQRTHQGRDTLRRRLKAWAGNRAAYNGGLALDENLAVGWFGSERPTQRTGSGHGLVVQALGGQNGRLTAEHGAELAPLINGVQNIPMHVVSVLRHRGAIHYAASLSNARGLPRLGELRPLSIDATSGPDEVWCGVHQSVLGQVGWGVDTRVSELIVDDVASFSSWFTSAHAADRLGGDGPLADEPPDHGPIWQGDLASFTRTLGGIRSEGAGVVHLTPEMPSGLIHLMVGQKSETEPRIGLLWRTKDASSTWSLSIDRHGTTVECHVDGAVVHKISGPGSLQSSRISAVAILDDGHRIDVQINGKSALDAAIEADDLAAETGVGLLASDARPLNTVRDFEAHPRIVACPTEILPSAPATFETGATIVDDDFAGVPGALEGRTVDDVAWTRSCGSLTFPIDATGVRVPKRTVAEPATSQVGRVGAKAASLWKPTGLRTAYTVPWQSPRPVEVELEMTPPGTAQGEGEKGRGGVIFSQDDDNFLIVSIWLDDAYEGTSVSSFFHLNGYEEILDAVWTNVDRRITWGERHTLRIGFDGDLYVVHVDDEPVLWRRLSDVYPHGPKLRIARVGLVSNWEYGDDTGTVFHRFSAAEASIQPSLVPFERGRSPIEG